MHIRVGLGANGAAAFGSIVLLPPNGGGLMFRTLTDELLELTAETKGATRAGFATTVACCCCCCSCKVM